MVFDEDTNELIADLTEKDRSLVSQKEGLYCWKYRFKECQSIPRKTIPVRRGHPIRLELKVLADVGLVGMRMLKVNSHHCSSAAHLK